jgi:hypothetical protein
MITTAALSVGLTTTPIERFLTASSLHGLLTPIADVMRFQPVLLQDWIEL